MDVSVVIPVFNEEDNLVRLYEELVEVFSPLDYSFELVFVDDGSTDDSFSLLKSLHEKDSRVKVIRLKRNFGQSGALQAGFDHSRADTIVSMDSDLQNDPRDIPKLLDKLDSYDVVCGWRKNREDPLMKRFFSRLASIIRRPFLGSHTHDYGCTLRAYRKEAVEDLDLMGELHRYIPPILRWRGFSVTEVEVNHRSRFAGSSSYGWRRLGKGFLDMLNVWFWQKFSGRPLHMFGGLGLISFSLGALGSLASFYLWFYQHIDLSDNFLPFASIFMIVIGIQFFVSGLLADISIKNYHLNKRRDGERETYSVKEFVK